MPRLHRPRSPASKVGFLRPFRRMHPPSVVERRVRIDPALDFLPRLLLGRTEARLIAARAAAQGVGADEAAIAEGRIDETRFYRALAAHLGVPFVAEPVPVALTPGRQAFRAGAAPLREGRGGFLLAPKGAALRSLLAGGRKLEGAVITTPSSLAESLLRAGEDTLAAQAAERLGRRAPALSSRTAVTRGPSWALFLGAVAIAAAMAFGQDGIAEVVSIVIAACFVPGAVLKILSGGIGGCAPETVRRPSDRELPRWSVIVALHREERVVERLLESLRNIDYPAAKLEVILAVERDDLGTLAALRAGRPPPNFRILVCPPGVPRTKPRALNIALAFCRGDFVTVYDAEDEPDPGQLREAAAAFAAGPTNLACVQARLAIDNADDGPLGRAFALDYASLFDRLLPGLVRLGLPIPLGGTSNHFRRIILERALAWDAWNVTEDADLGLRLARLGYTAGTIPSDTWEEAPTRIGSWLKQRCRWLKGWMQTGLMLVRDPVGLVRRVGLVRAGVMVVHTWGTVAAALFAPFVFIFAAEHIISQWTANRPLDGTVIYFVLIALLGTAAHLVPMLLAARERGLRFGPRELAFIPVHLVLVSAAAWIAASELVRAPSHWHKTEHGLASRRRRARRDEASVV